MGRSTASVLEWLIRSCLACTFVLALPACAGLQESQQLSTGNRSRQDTPRKGEIAKASITVKVPPPSFRFRLPDHASHVAPTPTLATVARVALPYLRSAHQTATPPLPTSEHLRRLAYADEGKHDFQAAVQTFNAYLHLRPHDDSARLSLAYDEIKIGDRGRANVIFSHLESSHDILIAARASAELRAQTKSAGTSVSAHADKPQSGTYATLAYSPVDVTAPVSMQPILTPKKSFGSGSAAYTALEYDSRFRDTITATDTYLFLSPQHRFQSYAVLHSSVDTRSSLGTTPLIYNDNAVILGTGVRYNLGKHLGTYLFSEAGEGTSLIGRGTHPEVRYGLASWSEHGNPLGRAHTSYGFSLASYSRYGGDAIGYGNILHDFPLPGLGSVRGVIGANFSLDSQRYFYNNIGEIVVGTQFRTSQFCIRLLAVRGEYLNRGLDQPAQSGYTSLRPTIFWSPRL